MMNKIAAYVDIDNAAVFYFATDNNRIIEGEGSKLTQSLCPRDRDCSIDPH